MKYFNKACCSLFFLLLIACRGDLDNLERTHSVQFYTDVSNVIIPDTISQKHIFRFKPKTTSKQYAIAIYLSSGGGELLSGLENINVSISDYDGNSIPEENSMHVESIRKGTINGTALRVFYGSYALSSDHHYRIEMPIPEFDPSILPDSFAIHVGIIEYD